MEITLSKYAGFCEGVARAYEMVEKLAVDQSVRRPIAVLGSLVHNSDVVERVEKMGIKKIDIDRPIDEIINSLRGQVGTLVITAHGMGPKIYNMIRNAGIDIVDTTCPRVIKVQRLAKAFYERKTQIVIVGDCKHSEVRGINEWGNESAVLIEDQEGLDNLSLDKDRPVAVISQTTQNEDFVRYAEKEIAKKYPLTTIMNSICMTTHDRQTEIRELAAQKDIVIIIGSPESANSNRLFQIARSVNPRSHFIANAGQIKKEWFTDCQTIGISAGASTPHWIIERVVCEIGKL